MNPTRLRTVARRLAAQSPHPAGPPAADADLLARFLNRHDEGAAGALVARHLPAVRAVCRSVLRDPHDADDAAQATFLVLVRRAAAVRDRQALGGWLCRVAWRTANRLREQNARRAARTQPGVEPDATPAARAAPADDTRAAVDEEVARLPEVYRLAVLTCYAAGVPTAEAAARLGWPKGTLLTRLAWARRRLRDRLTRRGVTPAGGLAGALGGQAGVAGSATLAGRAGQAMVAVLEGGPLTDVVSDRVLFLTEGVVRHMVGTKIKLLVGAGFAAVAVLGLGLGRMTAGADPGDKKPTAPFGAAAEKPAKPEKPAAGPVRAEKPDRADSEPGAILNADPAGPGDEVVTVRRPRGSYTREVAPYGRGTITFAEKRLYVVASVHIDGATLNVSLDADYCINQDGLLYGVITGADVTAAGIKADEAADLALYSVVATDMPFAFRLRVDDDAVSIRDIKFGPFGSPLLLKALGGGDDRETGLILGMIGGKYRADPNPDRPRPQPVAPRPRR